MANIFITGSADGLGLLAAKELISQGHNIVLHARNEQRGKEALRAAPGAMDLVTGDLANIEETIALASEINALGSFDAVIHNAGVYQAPGKQLLTVNMLAPYILTCLVKRPKRLIYLSSGMHLQGKLKAGSSTIDFDSITYSDSKFYLVAFCMAVARAWPDVYANVLDPGWVPTKMGGSGAPDDLQKGYETQVWLAASNTEAAKVSGYYFYHQQQKRPHPDAGNVQLQEQVLKICKELTGVSFP